MSLSFSCLATGYSTNDSLSQGCRECQACCYQPYIETSCRITLRVPLRTVSLQLRLSFSLPFCRSLSLSLSLSLSVSPCSSATPAILFVLYFYGALCVYLISMRVCVNYLRGIPSYQLVYHATSFCFFLECGTIMMKKMFTKMLTGIYVQRKQVSARTSACMHACASTALFRMRACVNTE